MPALVVPLFGVVCCTGEVGVVLSLEVGGVVDVGDAEVGGVVEELLGVAEVGVGVGVGVVLGVDVAAVQLKSVRKVN